VTAHHAPPALAVTDLTAGYGGTTVLRDVTLTVPPASVTALLGPNGAGKSTLLRVISGLVPASRGSVALYGRAIADLAPHRRARLGLCHIPEGRGVFRSLTVRENLRLQVAKTAEAAGIERACSAFPLLGQRLDQTAGTLSGGEQQMLAMAAAYVTDVSLILVDEASLGLAPRVVEEIFAFLRLATSEGCALLLVDQFATEALAMASTAYVLRQGRVAYGGPSGELATDDLAAQYLGADMSKPNTTTWMEER
jgi:branched-chain amino acid transport system ATP-binding protein